jgi:hypothetical protein
VTQIGRNRASRAVQTAQNAAGRLVNYDPKSSAWLWDTIKSWLTDEKHQHAGMTFTS